MARTKEFDPDEVLQAALELFWERGYETTSMADLVAHLGVARASLYATFGSKRDLYLKALDRYRDQTDPRVVERLSQPGPVLPAVRALLTSYAEESLSDERRRGCMIVNAAVEGMAGDAGVAHRVEGSWTCLESVLASALTRARAQGELPADRDPRELAGFLLVMLQGLRVVGRGRPDPVRVRGAVERAMAALA